MLITVLKSTKKSQIKCINQFYALLFLRFLTLSGSYPQTNNQLRHRKARVVSRITLRPLLKVQYCAIAYSIIISRTVFTSPILTSPSPLTSATGLKSPAIITEITAFISPILTSPSPLTSPCRTDDSSASG